MDIIVSVVVVVTIICFIYISICPYKFKDKKSIHESNNAEGFENYKKGHKYHSKYDD